MKCYTPVALSVASIVMAVTTAGATLTSGQNFAAIYNSSKALLGQTGDQSTAWTSTGVKSMSISGGPVIVPAGFYYVVVWSNGTTKPTFARGSNLNVTNGTLSNANSRFATADTGRTTTAPATLGTFGGFTTAYWCGVA